MMQCPQLRLMIIGLISSSRSEQKRASDIDQPDQEDLLLRFGNGVDRLSKFRPDAHRKRTARQSISNLKFCQIAASELPFTFKSLNAHCSASELNSNRFDVYGAASNDKATNKQTNIDGRSATEEGKLNYLLEFDLA